MAKGFQLTSKYSTSSVQVNSSSSVKIRRSTSGLSPPSRFLPHLRRVGDLINPHFLFALMSVVQTNRNLDFLGPRWVILELNCKLKQPAMLFLFQPSLLHPVSLPTLYWPDAGFTLMSLRLVVTTVEFVLGLVESAGEEGEERKSLF